MDITKYTIDGVVIGLGAVGYHYEKGIVIYLSEGDASDYIENKDSSLVDIIHSVYSQRHILDAWSEMDNFEHYRLQGYGGWMSLKSDYNYQSQNEFHCQAKLVLEHDDSTEYQKKVAQTIINVLYGDYIEPEKPEKSPEEKAKAAFDRKKPRLRLKLVIRDGYQCDNCGSNKENSLCIVKKDESSTVLEMENLTLRCRSCMAKIKNKNKK